MENPDSESDSDLVVESERPGTPTELVEAASKADLELLPAKSRTRYMDTYNLFQAWKTAKNATSNSETVVFAYLSEMANTKNKKNECLKPSTLWARYSMLKATMNIYDKVDIGTYGKLTAFLKRKSTGYVPLKAKIFTENEIQRFLDIAPDVLWLDVKVKHSFFPPTLFFIRHHICDRWSASFACLVLAAATSYQQ